MPPDAHLREQALDTTQSFLVQAPAGSGKTELLTQRFLALLATVDAPESIVAITFTRKAAGEMRTRISGALAKAAGPRPAEPHAQRTWELASAALARNGALNWGLLDNPGRLRIMTIDSLCASLTGQMPWMSRMGGQPSLADDPASLHHEAALRTLALLEQDTPWRHRLERLLLHLDNNLSRAAELLMQMLGRRDQWLRHITGGLNRAELEAALRAMSDHAVANLLPQVPFLAWDLLAVTGRANGPATDLERLQALADFILTDVGTARKRITKNEGFPPGHPRKKDMEQLCANCIDSFAAELHAIRSVPPPAYSDSQWAIIEALAAILQVAVAQLRLVFQERRTTDFVELTLSATQALGTDAEPTPLAYALDFQIQHLLLDEFQDTSISKMRLLERLTADWMPSDGRTIFAVGDPMQSIYSFQEADVSLFEQCRRHGLGRIPLTPLTLSANFRSSSNLIDWFNNAFPRVLAPQDDPAAGAVTYSPSQAQRSEQEGPPVVCHPVNAASEPAAVAALVEQILANNEKVAILVRRRADAHPIVAELKRRDILFQAVEMDPLKARPVIQDLRALTRALLHPADRVAWLSLLRAPWAGLELADITAIAASATICEGMSNHTHPRLQRIMPILDSALANSRRGSLRRTVEQTWRQLGGPACLRDDAEREDALTYFDLLDTLDAASDLPSFQLLDDALDKLCSVPDPNATGSVQIMTMHKSKGLEFDNVILPGLGNRPRAGNAALLRWQEHGGLVVGSIGETGAGPDPVYGYLGKLESRKADHEAGRLLYVAATRAKKRLHLVGGEPAAGSFLARLWHAVGEYFPNAAPAPEMEAQATNRGVRLRRVPENWQAPLPGPALQWPVAERVVDTTDPAFDWTTQTLRVIGTVVHRFLQQIAHQGLEHWSPEEIESRTPALRAQLSSLGVPREELPAAVDRATEALRQTLIGARGRWVLHSHPEAINEWELSGVYPGGVRIKKLDRTFVENGVRWIIDYKTGDHQGGNREGFLDQEVGRYREQLEGYAALVHRLDNRPIRLGIYFPLMDAWREWDPAAISVPPAKSATDPAED